MKNIVKTSGLLMVSCFMALSIYSCNSNNSAKSTKCTDSTATAAATTTTTDTTATGAAAADTTAMAAGSGSSRMAGKTTRESSSMMAAKSENINRADEPTGPTMLNVSSPAFTNYGVIPVKYTCDGDGVTPPLRVSNIPAGTKSLTLIIHDYNANPEGGYTYWIIWNLDTLGNIPENFRNSYEGMNAAKQYGYTPICSKSGSHKYHFIVYAADSRFVIDKGSVTKSKIEKIMKGHVLGKGEIVGVYNKQLE